MSAAATATGLDLTLVEAARSGDPAAIDRLLVACQPNIRRYAQRSCTISVVDDAVQETLLVLSRYVATLRHPAALSRWLFAVARRECRRLSRATLRLELWDEDRVDAWIEGKDEGTLRYEVAAALESLPEEYREIVVLRDFEGLTIGEAADRLGLSRAAIKSRLHRARALTREYLAPS